LMGALAAVLFQSRSNLKYKKLVSQYEDRRDKITSSHVNAQYAQWVTAPAHFSSGDSKQDLQRPVEMSGLEYRVELDTYRQSS
jgi:hypothetical protein